MMIIKFQFSRHQRTPQKNIIPFKPPSLKSSIITASQLYHDGVVQNDEYLFYIVLLLFGHTLIFYYIQIMSAPGEQEETIEFYKIQVMEKDREIADFAARMKKVEFKHSRDIKDAKIAKDRFEALLKEEKTKSDKYSRAAQQNAEQNQILELRLAELKRDKDKELADIQSKYNTLKEEVRSYERILPTFTFLTDLSLTINELPNYEDLYFNLREKTAEYQELKQAHEQAEIQWQQTIKNMKANEEVLKSKRVEAEKNMKEVLSKLLEQEHHISDLRLHNQNLAETVTQLEEELQLTRERCEVLEESVKDYECKIQKLAQDFEAELISKEEEVNHANQAKMIQLEEDVRNQQAQAQRKELAFNEQIRILEEEITFLSNKYHAEIETFEQHYLTIKQETERMRNEIANEKRRYDQLHERYNDSNNCLTKISALNEQTEEKNRALQLKISAYQQQLAHESRKNQQDERGRLEELQNEYEEVVEKLGVVSEHYSKLEEERDHLQEENFLLREELSAKQLEHNENKSFFLQLPKQTIDDRNRKKSAEMENSFNFDALKERRNSIEDGRLKELQKEIALLQKRSQLELQKQHEAENRAQLLQSDNLRLRNELENFKNQKEKLMTESIGLKEKIIQLTRTNNDYEKAAYGHSTKNKLERTRVECLEEEIKHLTEENKREKEATKKLKEDIKAMKQASTAESEKLTKEVKDLQVMLEVSKGQKEKLKQTLSTKEKQWNHQIALLKSGKEREELFKEQLRQSNIEKQQLELSLLDLQNKLIKVNDQIIPLQKENQKLETSLKQAIRETELANESLQRERKERTLLSVPSLQSINGEQAQEETFNQIYAKIPQKQGEINLLQRNILDLKEELETLKLTHHAKMELMESQNNVYVQTIIEMKMRCAQSQMRASEKEYLYSQLKKRAAAYNIVLK